MKKETVKKAFILLLLVGITIFAVAPVRFPEISSKGWMGELDDSRSIASLSIPGTHDSGAIYSFGGVFGKCQTLGIPRQLDVGVRFFDIRLRLVDNELRVYHDFVEQKAKFSDVAKQLVQFIQQNPTEFLIVSLKEEYSPLRSEKNFSRELEAELLRYPDFFCSADSLPENLGNARGKIYIIARYDDSSMGIGCYDGWKDNTAFELNGMYIQDHYKLDNTNEKFPDIAEAMDAASSGKYSLVFNFTSCYLTSGFPPSYSGTPAGAINPWLLQKISEADGPLGILICDFMTSELSQSIIGRNFS